MFEKVEKGEKIHDLDLGDLKPAAIQLTLEQVKNISYLGEINLISRGGPVSYQRSLLCEIVKYSKRAVNHSNKAVTLFKEAL